MKKTITAIIITTLLSSPISANAETKSLNIKNNQSICKNIKLKYQSDVMLKWPNGLSSDQDVLKEIDLNIKMLTSKQKQTNGKIKTVIGYWIKTEQNTKNALINKNVEEMMNAMNLKIKYITEFDKICKGIKK